jgi:CHASE2 domain-containing sensor protein
VWRAISRKISEEIPLWRLGAVPGILVIAIVLAARLTGWLQLLEWSMLDTLLRLRPGEGIDERIAIVGIDEEDIRRVGTYPIPDREIATLIKILQTHKPRAIGLDLVRDLPVEPGHVDLVKVFKESNNLIAIEKVLPPQISSPPDVPSERVGFSDATPDLDGKYRRNLLGTPTATGYKFSLSLRLAEAYLAREGISLENGIRDPQAMLFSSTEIPRFFANSGGYVGTDAGGVQVLLNYRSGKDRFRFLSLNDIKTGKFNPEWIRERVVLIGITAPSAPDLINTSTLAGLQLHGQAYGVEFQAHATSQILNAVLEGRPLLKTWSDGWEYLWIVGWGLIAISLGRLTQSVLKNLLATGLISLCLIGAGYLSLLFGWWLSIAPALLILAINSVGLSAFAFYQRDRALRLQIEVRQSAIEEAFTSIHNGPLQDLAYISRTVQEKNLPQEELFSQLQKLNNDLREIFDILKQKALSKEESIHLGSGLTLDLNRPIHELFYEVCRSTLERNLPYFPTLKVKILDFQPIKSGKITLEQKRELCRFLEEALCNVGKHAKGVTRLSATGSEKDGYYILKIQDNGAGISSLTEGEGTKQIERLAKQLKGNFKRESLLQKGTLCELIWQI